MLLQWHMRAKLSACIIPVDAEVSRLFARQFINKLFENAAFREEFELVKKEWAEKVRKAVKIWRMCYKQCSALNLKQQSLYWSKRFPIKSL